MSGQNLTLFGRVAIAAKFLTMEQLNDALREQARDGRQLGDILIEKGYLTAEQLERLVEMQRSVLDKVRAKRAAEQAPEGIAPLEGIERTSTPDAVDATGAPEEATEDEPAFGVDTDPDLENRINLATVSLDTLLRRAVEAGASDLHLHSGSAVKLRAKGQFFDHGTPLVEPDQGERLALEAMSPEERAVFQEKGELDLCYTLSGVGRFRTNVYRQLRGTDAVFRVIPPKPPSLEELGLPSTLARFTTYHQGMLLVTGPTSCGKSATLAALVNLINEERPEHILTIEDPIEYLHPSKRCLVNQRSVNRHTRSFARALRAALREDPDVIVIGELRDRETISLALTAAETGHFVLATLHTNSAVRTINRIVGAFPPDQQEQVRTMLSESLRAVISQRLLPKADGSGLALALEVMVGTLAVGNMIRENKTIQIRSLLQTGAEQGMVLLDNSLATLVRDGIVDREEALRHAEDAKAIPA